MDRLGSICSCRNYHWGLGFLPLARDRNAARLSLEHTDNR